MNENVKRLVSCLIVVCLIISMLAILSQIVERKGSYIKYQDFFGQQADFDVLFFGSSKVLNGIFPMELWNDYGIVSYNMGGHGTHLPTSYWLIQNALDYTTPKLIVLDCFTLFSNLMIDKEKYLHVSFDRFPLSKNKISAIFDLIREDEGEKGDINAKRIEFLWDFAIYHNRWSELTKEDFFPTPNVYKGADPRINVAVPEKMGSILPEEKMTEKTVGYEYLVNTIELCQQRGLEILLINIPFPTTNKAVLSAANTVYDIAEEYGVNYINFFDVDLIDYNTDCYDPNSHLNPSGAQKISKYLGEYISRNYDISDQRGNQEYKNWYEDSKEYYAEKVRLISEQELLSRYLMLLADDDFSFVMDIMKPLPEKNDQLRYLLKNLGINPDAIKEPCYVVVDRVAGTVEVIKYEVEVQNAAETSFGALSNKWNDKGKYSEIGNSIWKIATTDEQAQYDVRIGLYSVDREHIETSWFHFE